MSVLKCSVTALELIRLAVLTVQRVEVMTCHGLNPKWEDLLAECIQADLRLFFFPDFLQTKCTRSVKSQSAKMRKM